MTLTAGWWTMTAYDGGVIKQRYKHYKAERQNGSYRLIQTHDILIQDNIRLIDR